MKKFAIPFIIILALFAIGKFYYYQMAEKKIRQVIGMISPMTTIRYQNIDVDYFGKIILHDVRVENHLEHPLFYADALVINDYDIENNAPVKLDLEIKKLKLIAKPGKNNGSIGFYELGFKKISSNIGIKYDYSSFSNRLTFITNIELLELGKLHFDIELANLDMEQWKYYFKDPGSILFMKGNLKYQDMQLAKKVIAKIKEQKNLTDTEFQNEIQYRMNELLKQNQKEGVNKTDYENFLRDWLKFILSPENITISASNKDGYSLRQILKAGNKAELITPLSIKLNVNKKDFQL